MKRVLIAVVAVAFVALVSTARAADDPTGTWKWETNFGGKTRAGVRTHVITFGEVALVGCNIEPFCEIGLAIKKASPFPVTFMCGYTNGRMAYMPTADDWPSPISVRALTTS